jgi:2-iminobutanoate/2-iminopropanoate deaminase
MKNLIILTLVVFIALATAFQPGDKKDKHDLTVITTKNAPAPIGPYSQAIKVGKDIYCAGQIGMDPATNAFAGPDIKSQATQVLNNLKAVVEAAGSDMEHVAKVSIFLKDMNDFATVNDIYKDYFPGIKPARCAIQLARLPKDALVEMECVAISK